MGVGSSGERHLRTFRGTGRTEVAFCELNDALRQTIADRYGLRKTYAHLDEAASDSFDAAVVAAPAHLHVELATRLVESGHHLLIEKPLSTRLEGVDRLSELAGQKNLVVAVGYSYRARSAAAATKRALDSGRFGRPVQIVCIAGQHFPTYRPAYREIYYRDRATGGGAIQDGLTHCVNLGEWFVGPVDRVVADAAHQVLEGVEVEDTVHVLTRHGDVLGSYSLNQHQAPNEITFTVVCENGTIRYHSHLDSWEWKMRPEDPWETETYGPFDADVFFTSQANAFLDAIEQEGSPLCTLEEGIQTLRVNLAILESVDSGNGLLKI